LWTDVRMYIHMHGQTDGQTIETGFIRSILSNSRPNYTKLAQNRIAKDPDFTRTWRHHRKYEKLVCSQHKNQTHRSGNYTTYFHQQLEESSTHRSTIIHAGTVFVPHDLDLWPSDQKINRSPGFIVKYVCVKFHDIVWKNRQTDRQTDKHTNAADNPTHATVISMGNNTIKITNILKAVFANTRKQHLQ